MYRIQACLRRGLLNEILCTYSPVEFPRTNARTAFTLFESVRFLRTFDLNCVQVGVRLSDKALVWTPAFERFHRTHEMLVESVKTPLHTAIRWFKKKRELEGLYGHDDRAMELLCATKWSLDFRQQRFEETHRVNLLDMFQCSGKAAAHTTDLEDGATTPAQARTRHPALGTDWAHRMASRLVFSRVYKARLDSVRSDIERYFTIRTLEGTRISLHTLEPKALPELDPAIVEHSPSALLPWYVRAKQGYWKKHISQQVLELFSSFKDGPRAHLSHAYKFHALLRHGVDVVANAQQRRDLQGVCRNIEEHQGFARMAGQLDHSKYVLFSRTLQTLAKEKGLYVFGFVDQSCFDFLRALTDCEIADVDQITRSVLADCEQRAVEARANATFLLKRPLTGVTFEGYRLNELRDTKELFQEGNKMHHCVGGYSTAVFQGISAIVSFRKPLVQDCLTLEVRESKSVGGWSDHLCLTQIRGLTNRSPTYEESKVADIVIRALNVQRAFGWALPFSLCLKLAQKLPRSIHGVDVDTLLCVRVTWPRIKRALRLAALSTKARRALSRKAPQTLAQRDFDEWLDIPF